MHSTISSASVTSKMVAPRICRRFTYCGRVFLSSFSLIVAFHATILARANRTLPARTWASNTQLAASGPVEKSLDGPRLPVMADYLTCRPREIGVRNKTPQTPRSTRFSMLWDDDLPVIDQDETFGEVVAKFIGYITRNVDVAYSYEQLRTSFGGQSLKPFILRLSDECHNPAVVAALLAAKYVFKSIDDEGTGLSGTRGLACEIVAWQFLTYLSEKEMIDYLLYDVPDMPGKQLTRKLSTSHRVQGTDGAHGVREDTPLLHFSSQGPPQTCDSANSPVQSPRRSPSVTNPDVAEEDEVDAAAPDATYDIFLKPLVGMNALEVAGIASAKEFLRQRPVQKIVDDIWNGNVMFWESLSIEAKRRPKTYNKRVADPFSRLRVPRYQKAFQIGFFISFLVLFYAVLVGPITQRITLTEGLLYWWIAAYTYDEFSEIQDAGLIFYGVDFWAIWDIGIIAVSVVFVVLRVWGIARRNEYVMDMAFDVLSMTAILLVPRIFSVMSLNPYFGSLIPVLKEMTRTFLRFLPIIIVLYLGFLTTFTMLAREHHTFRDVSYTLIAVFFGSSSTGFEFAVKISPYFGYPLMLIFVCLTNILLLTSLISLVSNSLSEVMAHARTEYLFQYSIYVLESSSSRRLTYFMPPLNLIPLLLLRPLRLVLPSEHVRRIRIVLLKATHIPFIALIWAYEGSTRLVNRGSQVSSNITRSDQLTPRPLSAGVQMERGPYARRPCLAPTLANATPANAPIDFASGIAEADMLKLIQKMSSQLDELTAVVAARQKD